jgi:hypothetical protein
MRMQIESTAEIVTIYGVACRQWKGVTENGIECHVFIKAIACHRDDDAAEFQQELIELPQPTEHPLSD